MLKYHGADKDFSLDGKIAIVTGGAAGIGLATVQFFALKNVMVIAADLNPQVDAIVKAVDARFVGIAGDITQSDYRQSVVDYAINHFGRIDILVNSAGIAILEKAQSLSEEKWDLTMNLNLKASFLMAQQVGRQMITQQEGSIVNMASQAGVIALDEHVAYCASKAAVISMTQVLAYEWGQYGVRVNCVSPTVVMTELGKNAWAGQKGEDMKKQIPALRFAEPDEIAASIAFLCSKGAGMITGANLMIDGGYTIK